MNKTERAGAHAESEMSAACDTRHVSSIELFDVIAIQYGLRRATRPRAAHPKAPTRRARVELGGAMHLPMPNRFAVAQFALGLQTTAWKVPV
jgi:hypothetical protein